MVSSQSINTHNYNIYLLIHKVLHSKKMKIPFIFLKNKQQWQWPSCKHPKTLSFRETTNNVDPVFKTVNSLFLDTSDVSLETPESYRFTNSSFGCATSTTTTTTPLSDENNSSLEMIVRSVRLSNSERLFFEPGHTSSSLVKEEISVNMNNNESQGIISIDHDEMSSSSVAVVAMESDNPYLDFKKSMAEMVKSHGLIKEWDCLEELLGWYLKMNSNNNHAFIVAAFLDLLLPSSSTSSMGVCCSDSASYSSADSCFSSHSS